MKLERRAHRRARKSLRQAASLYRTDQVAEFDRTALLSGNPVFAEEGKTGLCMQWSGEAFAQISMELAGNGKRECDFTARRLRASLHVPYRTVGVLAAAE